MSRLLVAISCDPPVEECPVTATGTSPTFQWQLSTDGGTTFTLFTEGEWAWPASAEEDTRIVDALKNGSEAVLTGQSGRGTVTRDTFSLLGFTSAVDQARTRCTS